MEAWRIVKRKYAAGAFSGEGAYLNGGRWNSVGTRVEYVSESLSLAALEVLVHLPAGVPITFSTFRIRFDDALIETLVPNNLPKPWRAEPPGRDTQSIGDDWAREARSAVLAIPSAIIPQETNFLVNPVHPDFAKIEIAPPEPFAPPSSG